MTSETLATANKLTKHIEVMEKELEGIQSGRDKNSEYANNGLMLLTLPIDLVTELLPNIQEYIDKQKAALEAL